MIYLIVLILCSLFVAFFALLELWYFGIFPLLFLILFFSQSFVDMRMTLQGSDFVKKYGLYGFSLLVFFGLLGMLEFMGFSYETVFFILLFLCWFAWYGSYLIDYNDGKQLFFHGFLFILVLLAGNRYVNEGIPGFISLFSPLIGIAALGFGGLKYIIGRFKEVDDVYEYLFFYTLLFGLFYVLFINIGSKLYALDIDLLVYMVLLLGAGYLLRYKPASEGLKKREISLRRVLAGEKILDRKKKGYQSSKFLENLSMYLRSTPEVIKYLCEYLNVLLLVGVLLAYLIPVFQGHKVPQLWYRGGIVFFLINAFFMKKDWVFSVVSRFAVVVVINFSLYISLLVFGEDIYSMIPWLIAWNLLCGLVCFYAKLPGVRTYIKQIDLIFWLIASLVAMLLNIVLLLRLDAIAGQIVFSLIFLYLGAWGWIAFYLIRLIKEYPTVIENEKTDAVLEMLEEEK